MLSGTENPHTHSCLQPPLLLSFHRVSIIALITTNKREHPEEAVSPVYASICTIGCQVHHPGWEEGCRRKNLHSLHLGARGGTGAEHAGAGTRAGPTGIGAEAPRAPVTTPGAGFTSLGGGSPSTGRADVKSLWSILRLSWGIFHQELWAFFSLHSSGLRSLGVQSRCDRLERAAHQGRRTAVTLAGQIAQAKYLDVPK